METYDVCVIGSGAAGGMAAWNLASQGARVVVLEGGDWVKPGQFIGHKPPHAFDSRGLAGEYTRHLFTPEPFKMEGNAAPFRFGVLRAVGGKTLLWSAHVFRFSEHDFQSARKLGASIDWPVRYQELAPCYARVERLIGIAASPQSHPNVPDSVITMKSIGLRCADHELMRGLAKLKRGYSLFPIPKAINTQGRDGRPACHWCGHCNYGCEVDSKYTSANTAVPKAVKTGRCQLVVNAHVVKLEASDGLLSAARYIDAASREERLVTARAFVLACGPIETARLLLVSGLANSSGQVGRNLMSHINPFVQGYLPQLEGAKVVNDDGTDNFHGIIPDVYWNRPSGQFAGGYHIQTTGGAQQGIHFGRGVEWAAQIPGFGEQFKNAVRRRLPALVGLHPQGTMPPSAKNYVELDSAGKNAFGLPAPRILMNYGANEESMARDMIARSSEIIEAAGGKVTTRSPRLSHDPFHYVGTCRMGDDAKQSVVNRHCQAHDVANLFIADGSAFVAYPEKNPTLTVMALALWSTDHLMRLSKRGWKG
ncbi:MAG: GMC family oxidoreductase [Acidobacteria bacterium]|nr:GMC family oxidoreductase [Acidobacteriota bacterium]